MKQNCWTNQSAKMNWSGREQLIGTEKRREEQTKTDWNWEEERRPSTNNQKMINQGEKNRSKYREEEKISHIKTPNQIHQGNNKTRREEKLRRNFLTMPRRGEANDPTMRWNFQMKTRRSFCEEGRLRIFLRRRWRWEDVFFKMLLRRFEPANA